jgi:hypothetical protein
MTSLIKQKKYSLSFMVVFSSLMFARLATKKDNKTTLQAENVLTGECTLQAKSAPSYG